MDIFALIAVVLVCTVAGLQAWSRRRALELSWREAARQLGLSYVPRALMRRGTLAGSVGGLEVKVEIGSRETKQERTEYYTRAAARVAERLPSTAALTAESRRSKLGKIFTGQDMATGDHCFDDIVYIRGPEVPMRAALNATARTRVAEIVTCGGGLEDGILYAERKGALDSPGEIARLVWEVLAAARDLTSFRGDIQGALAANARDDPHAGVRLQNLTTLLQRYPAAPAAGEALQAALGDPDARMRLLGAKSVGKEEAFPVLASLVADTTIEDALRAEALRTLVSSHSYEEAAPSVAAAIEDPDPQIQREAVEAVGKFRDASLYDRVVRLGARADDPLARTLAQTLGRLGDPRAERPLLLLLARESAAVKAAAAAALGLVGTVEAVEPLLPLTKGLLESGEVKEAAREAIQRIQARLGGAEAGRVSLVAESEKAGAVSLAGPGGAVSLAQPPDADPEASLPGKKRSKT